MHIVKDHIEFMRSNSIEVEPRLQHLPSLYCLPKLHKQPYGSRFIAVSNKCSTKPLSRLLTACLSKIVSHFEQYCSGIYSRTGVTCFWIIKHSQQVLSTVHKIYYFSTAKHFDFCYIQVFHTYLLNWP